MQPLTTLYGPNGHPFAEGTDFLYDPTEPLKYYDDTPVVSGHIDTFTFSTVDEATNLPIREDIEVLGAGNGTLSAEGMLVVPITAVDTAAIGTEQIQWRRVTFELLTNAGISKNWAVRFRIRNLTEVP
jgi:hypothetical protein